MVDARLDTASKATCACLALTPKPQSREMADARLDTVSKATTAWRIPVMLKLLFQELVRVLLDTASKATTACRTNPA